MDEEDVIKKILEHFGLWDQKERLTLETTGPPNVPEYGISYSFSQIPMPLRTLSGKSDK